MVFDCQPFHPIGAQEIWLPSVLPNGKTCNKWSSNEWQLRFSAYEQEVSAEAGLAVTDGSLEDYGGSG